MDRARAAVICRLTGLTVAWLSVATVGVSAQQLQADFNRDGLPDQVSLVQGRSVSRLVIAVSGSPAVISLTARGTFERVAAVDLDHDGDLDLVAGRSDLRVKAWINAGLGLFVQSRGPARPRVPLPVHVVSVLVLPVLAAALPPSDPVAMPADRPGLFLPPVRTPAGVGSSRAASETLFAPRTSRAPPLA